MLAHPKHNSLADAEDLTIWKFVKDLTCLSTSERELLKKSLCIAV